MDQEKMKVLVVDDDENLRTVLVDKLNFSGFDAQGAHDGEEGLKIAEEIHPVVILADLLMPKLNGWQFLEKLKQTEVGKKAKVILLTALDNKEFVAKAMEAGAHGYLVKTAFNLDQVVVQVKEAIAGNKVG